MTAGVFGEAAPVDGSLPGEVFRLEAAGEGPAEVALSNDGGEELRFGVDGEGNIFVDRSRAGVRDFNRDFAGERFGRISAPRLFTGPWMLELIFDRSVCELFADGGTRVFTQLVYPSGPYTRVRVTGEAKAWISAAVE